MKIFFLIPTKENLGMKEKEKRKKKSRKEKKEKKEWGRKKITTKKKKNSKNYQDILNLFLLGNDDGKKISDVWTLQELYRGGTESTANNWIPLEMQNESTAHLLRGGPVNASGCACHGQNEVPASAPSPWLTSTLECGILDTHASSMLGFPCQRWV